MKTLILFSVLVCSLSLMAQVKPDNKSEYQIPKKAWKIIVKDSLSSADNFNLIGKTLRENNFTIETQDKESIKSGVHFVGRTSSLYFLNFSIGPGIIIITGQFGEITPGAKSESKFNTIFNQGMWQSPMKNAFNAMNNFALQLKGTREYITD